MKFLKFYEPSTKPPPYYSQILLFIGDPTLYLQPFEHRILIYSLTAYEYKSNYEVRTTEVISDFSFIPLHNVLCPFQSFTQILMQNPLNHPLTFVKRLIGYAQQDVSFIDLQTTKCRINELTEFMDAYTANYLTHGSSETLSNYIA